MTININNPIDLTNPGPIGGTTPAAGSFTTLNSSDNASFTGSNSTTLAKDIAAANNFSNGIWVRKRGTTGDATAAVASGGEVGFHSFYSWDGSAYGRNAYAIVKATEAQSTGSHGGQYKIAVTANGTNDAAIALTIDQDRSLLGTYSIKSSSPTGGIGYAAGAGATVTQATSKSTSVELDNVCGAITMNGAALAAGTIVSFVLTDSAIAAGDVLVLNHISGGTVGAYSLNAQCAAGSATINVRNNSAGSLSEAVVIQFALIKAVNA